MLDGNHQTICKYSSMNEAAYKTVQRRFDAIATNIRMETLLTKTIPSAYPAVPMNQVSSPEQEVLDDTLEQRFTSLRTTNIQNTAVPVVPRPITPVLPKPRFAHCT
jgi:hypothetical protein